MLALDVRQALGQVGYRVVQCDESHGQLYFLGLVFLVLGGQLFTGPFLLLLQIHIVEGYHLTHPGINHRVNITLACGKVTCNISNEVQTTLLTVNIEHHACRQRTDSGTDSR